MRRWYSGLTNLSSNLIRHHKGEEVSFLDGKGMNKVGCSIFRSSIITLYQYLPCGVENLS